MDSNSSVHMNVHNSNIYISYQNPPRRQNNAFQSNHIPNRHRSNETFEGMQNPNNTPPDQNEVSGTQMDSRSNQQPRATQVRRNSVRNLPPLRSTLESANPFLSFQSLLNNGMETASVSFFPLTSTSNNLSSTTSVQELRSNTVLEVYNSENVSNNSGCAICHNEFSNNCIVRKISHCGHFFHSYCLEEWFESHQTCPVCRHSIRTIPEAPAPSSGTNSREENQNVTVTATALLGLQNDSGALLENAVHDLLRNAN